MIVHVNVKPNAKVDSITVIGNNELDIRIREVAVEGKANKYLVSYLSKVFRVPKSSITILKGFHTRHKTISIIADDDHIENILNCKEW
jgi:uncharacterized protein (TIGR00251 family)